MSLRNPYKNDRAAKQRSQKHMDGRQQSSVSRHPHKPQNPCRRGQLTTAGQISVSVGDNQGSHGAPGGHDRGEPHASLRGAAGELGLQPAPRAHGQREASSVRSQHGPTRTGARTQHGPLGVASALGRKWGGRQRPKEEKTQRRAGGTGPQLSRLVETTEEEP